MNYNNRWSVFPEKNKEIKSEERKKRFLNIKTKSFLLISFNLLLIGVYLYTNRNTNILERIIYGLSNLEFPIIFEILILLIFFVITLIGIIVWIYFFIKETTFPAEKKKEKYFLNLWYETKIDIDIVIIIALAIRLFIQPFSVFGSSMEPNFHNHQYIIVNQISYRFQKPQRGDVVVFKYPRNKNKNYIKRIIGLPSERIVIENNQVIIYNENNPQGIELQENYLSPNIKTTTHNKEFSDITLKDNEYYMLGDNREASSDSRDWGTLSKNLIIGKAWIICWPLNDWKIINKVNYDSKSLFMPIFAFIK